MTQAADREGRRLARRLAATLGAERVVVTGCSAQRDPAPYAALGLRLVAGNSHKERLLELLNGPRVAVEAPQGAPPVARVKGLRVAGHSSHARAYLRVQDGCNQSCTFCTLPSVRGTSASVPLSTVREEAAALADAGHGEIVLTGAHLGSYGYDLTPRVALPALIEAVLEAASAARVRLSSLEPRFVSEGLLRLLREEPRLCPHLHLPLQSGDDGVLARMRRAYRSRPYEARALAAAEASPGLALGADFIVGFPGEDDVAFARTMEMVERLPYTYGHVFSYSDRPGTPAAALDGHVAPEVIRRRSSVLRGALERKKTAFLASHVGREVEVVVESVEPGWIAQGTTERFLPARVSGEGASPSPGERIRARVRAVREGVMEAVKTATALFVIAVCAGIAQADPSCPLSNINCNGEVTTSHDPQFSKFCRDPYGVLGQGSASYDLVAGLLTSQTTARGEQGAAASPFAIDDFRIVGVSGHCPDGIVANLHVHGRFDRAGPLNEGLIAATIQDMTAQRPPKELYLLTHVTTVTDTVISWPLHHCVGDVFQIQYELHTSVTLGDYTATAQLSFSGVPPGFAIMSCQGYSTEGPIATLPVSWGSVKARYR